MVRNYNDDNNSLIQDQPHIRTADEAIEAVKESILDEAVGRRPTINQNALDVPFLNSQNFFQVFLYVWFVVMGVLAIMALYDSLHVDHHNRSIYLGTSVIVSGLLIIIMLILSGFHQEKYRNLSKAHFLNINMPWIIMVVFAIIIALSYSVLDTEIEDDIGSIFDDDDSFTMEKFEAKFSEAILFAFYVLGAAIPFPYMVKSILAHANPQIESPEPEFTTSVRLAVERGDSNHSAAAKRKPRNKKRASSKKYTPYTRSSSSSRPPVRSMYG